MRNVPSQPSGGWRGTRQVAVRVGEWHQPLTASEVAAPDHEPLEREEDDQRDDHGDERSGGEQLRALTLRAEQLLQLDDDRRVLAR